MVKHVVEFPAGAYTPGDEVVFASVGSPPALAAGQTYRISHAALVNASVTPTGTPTPPVPVVDANPIRIQRDTGLLTIDISGWATGETGWSLTPKYGVAMAGSGTGIVVDTDKIATGDHTVTLTPKNADGDGAAVTRTLRIGPRNYVAHPFDELVSSWTQANVDALIVALKAGGFSGLRTDLHWHNTNPSPGTYTWGNYLLLAQRCAAAGFGLQWVVHIAPTWAKPAGVTGNGPGDPKAFGIYFAKATAVFNTAPLRADMEIWNEPNLSGFWQIDQGAAPLAYMTIEAFRSIKQVRKEIIVTSAGLSSVETGVSSGSAIGAKDFFATMAATDIRFMSSFDRVGIHPYVRPLSIDGTEGYNAMRILRELKDEVRLRGRPDAEFDLTEYGAPANDSTAAAVFEIVTLAEQLAYVQAILDNAATKFPEERQVCHYSKDDRNIAIPSEPENVYGVGGKPAGAFLATILFGTGTVVALPASKLDVVDGFYGAAGTDLTARTADIGTGWTKPAYATSASPKVDGNGRLYGLGNSTTLYNNTESADQNFWVEGLLHFMTSVANDVTGIAFRINKTTNTLLRLGWHQSDGLIKLFKIVGGTGTQIGGTFNPGTLTANQQIRIRAELTAVSGGDLIRCYVNDRMAIWGNNTAGDVDNTQKAAGVKFNAAQTATTGMQLADFRMGRF